MKTANRSSLRKQSSRGRKTRFYRIERSPSRISIQIWLQCKISAVGDSLPNEDAKADALLADGAYNNCLKFPQLNKMQSKVFLAVCVSHQFFASADNVGLRE
jgi:hypothetical protein